MSTVDRPLSDSISRGNRYLHFFRRRKLPCVFFGIFLLKLVLNNLREFSLVFFAQLAYMRMTDILIQQVSIKDRGSIKILVFLFFLAFGLLVYVYYLSSSLFNDNTFIANHLAFKQNKGIRLDCFNIVWEVFILDVFVRVLVIIIKLLITLIVRLSSFSKTNHTTPSPIGTYDSIESVMERGRGSLVQEVEKKDRSTTGFFNMVSGFMARSNFLRRRDVTCHYNLNHNGKDASGEENSSFFHAVSYFENLRYLKLRRALTVIDALSLCYRSMIPFPLWYGYFAEEYHLSGQLLSSLYLVCKITDISYKGIAALEAVIYLAIPGTLEFGYYSSEGVVGLSECPICFDRPSRPITLPSCSHSFCECCIHEWLERELSCPVCREKVSSTSRCLASIRKQSLAVPVII